MSEDVFNFKTHLLKSCLDNDVHTTASIYHQLIILPIMCNIGVEYIRPTLALISNSSNILISITLAPN